MLAFLLTNFVAVTDAAAAACNKPKLLGIFQPWYQYLDVQQRTIPSNGATYCSVQKFNLLGSSSDVPLVLLAVVDDLLRLAGLVAVGYVVYGGIQYATSQGNPDQTAKAQSTIINALIGLAIALIAVATVSFLGNKLST
jgi:lysylphosphatidylglycerol synthetase-like protein (DUF2156 family)